MYSIYADVFSPPIIIVSPHKTIRVTGASLIRYRKPCIAEITSRSIQFLENQGEKLSKIIISLRYSYADFRKSLALSSSNLNLELFMYSEIISNEHSSKSLHDDFSFKKLIVILQNSLLRQLLTTDAFSITFMSLAPRPRQLKD